MVLKTPCIWADVKIIEVFRQVVVVHTLNPTTQEVKASVNSRPTWATTASSRKGTKS